MKTKYVVFDNGRHEDMIVFSDMQQHDQMTRGLPGPAVSAGFISMYTDFGGDQLVECYGDSISLGIKSRPEEDEKIARRVLGWGK